MYKCYVIVIIPSDYKDVQKAVTYTVHNESKIQNFIANEAGCSQSEVSKHINRKLSVRKKYDRERWNRENRSNVTIVQQNPYQNSEKPNKDWGWDLSV